MEPGELNELRQIIGRADFTHLVPTPVLEEILPKFYPISFKEGERVIQRGASAGAFIIIASGKMDVIVQNEKGEDFVLKTLVPVDYVGEMALLSGSTRNATIITREQVKAYLLGKAAFSYLLEAVPEVKEFFLKVAERRQKDVKKKALDMEKDTQCRETKKAASTKTREKGDSRGAGSSSRKKTDTGAKGKKK
ncbi:MAG: cyclic nucleotide-binding domain-containing protein [Vulcanimicrobiota bacterium]